MWNAGNMKRTIFFSSLTSGFHFSAIPPHSWRARTEAMHLQILICQRKTRAIERDCSSSPIVALLCRWQDSTSASSTVQTRDAFCLCTNFGDCKVHKNCAKVELLMFFTTSLWPYLSLILSQSFSQQSISRERPVKWSVPNSIHRLSRWSNEVFPKHLLILPIVKAKSCHGDIIKDLFKSVSQVISYQLKSLFP